MDRGPPGYVERACRAEALVQHQRCLSEERVCEYRIDIAELRVIEHVERRTGVDTSVSRALRSAEDISPNAISRTLLLRGRRQVGSGHSNLHRLQQLVHAIPLVVRFKLIPAHGERWQWPSEGETPVREPSSWPASISSPG